MDALQLHDVNWAESYEGNINLCNLRPTGLEALSVFMNEVT
jgi:hypothetical protein